MVPQSPDGFRTAFLDGKYIKVDKAKNERDAVGQLSANNHSSHDLSKLSSHNFYNKSIVKNFSVPKFDNTSNPNQI